MIDQKGETPQKSDGEDLLSLASHELRTTLSIIKWYTEMLLDGDCGPLNDDQIKYLKTIEGSNQRAIDLVRSLLNVSRLNLGTFCINPTEIDVKNIVHEVLLQNQTKITEKKLHIYEDYGQHGDINTVLSLDKQVIIVLMRSLLSNAILFSKDGGDITIKVYEVKQNDSLEGEILPYDSLVIAVSDTGIGIPKTEHDKIFSKLFRASNAKDSNETGSGLSLYIVQSILEKIGGSIWFRSEENLGTTFYIALPKTGMIKKVGKVNLD